MHGDSRRSLNRECFITGCADLSVDSQHAESESAYSAWVLRIRPLKRPGNPGRYRVTLASLLQEGTGRSLWRQHIRRPPLSSKVTLSAALTPVKAAQRPIRRPSEQSCLSEIARALVARWTGDFSRGGPFISESKDNGEVRMTFAHTTTRGEPCRSLYLCVIVIRATMCDLESVGKDSPHRIPTRTTQLSIMYEISCSWLSRML